jgi:hypothetical protein
MTTQMPPPAPASRPPAPSATQPAPPFRFGYSFGRIEPRCPQTSIDKEIAQAMSALADDVPEGERMHQVLAFPSNQYLVRNLCWVFSVRGRMPSVSRLLIRWIGSCFLRLSDGMTPAGWT